MSKIISIPQFDFLCFGVLVWSLVLIFIFLVRFSSKKDSFFFIPHIGQSLLAIFFETVSSLLYDTIYKKGEKYFLFITVIFFFIVLITLIRLVPYSFTVTDYLIITVTMSFSIFIVFNIICIKIHKQNMLSLFLPSNTSFGLALLLVPIEFVSYIFKPISLGVRLLANLMGGFYPYLSRGLLGFLDKEYLLLKEQMEICLLLGETSRAAVDNAKFALDYLVEGDFVQAMIVKDLLRDIPNLHAHIPKIDHLLTHAIYQRPMIPGILYGSVPDNIADAVNYVLFVEEMGIIPVYRVFMYDPFVALVMLRDTLKLPHTEGFYFMANSAYDILTRFLIIDGSSKATSIASSNALNIGGELVTPANVEFASLTISSVL
jgi:ATP synthase subunit 6